MDSTIEWAMGNFRKLTTGTIKVDEDKLSEK
jgi:hypothetical protein